MQRRPIYSWLTRLDTDEPLEQAVTDVHHSGRKQKLSETEQNEFDETVHNPPDEVGIDAPALVQQYLEDAYDVDYSLPSCRRLLKEAGLSYHKPRWTAAEATETKQEAFRDDLKKSGGRWTPT